MLITKPGEVIVSDITYLKTAKRGYYLSLAVDAYSRKIIGYNIGNSLSSFSPICALKQAIEHSGYKYSIHHSDGGIQYVCKEYQDLLEQYGIIQSMTRPSSPQENPIIEHINGILKHEYDLSQTFEDYHSMVAKTKLVIEIYNNIRPHWALKLNTPSIVHQGKYVSTFFRT